MMMRMRIRLQDGEHGVGHTYRHLQPRHAVFPKTIVRVSLVVTMVEHQERDNARDCIILSSNSTS